MDNATLLNYIIQTLTDKVIVPTNFHDQVGSVRSMLLDDVTGLIDSLTDFQVNSAVVDYTIQTTNTNFTKNLAKWQDSINSNFRGLIPSGLKPLTKEYFKERWKNSSFPILNIGKWENIGGLTVPTELYFLKGESVYAHDKNPEDDNLGLFSYDYYLGNKREDKYKIKKDSSIFTRPNGRWYDKYPIPYLVKNGVYHNYRLFKSLKSHQHKILTQIIPYLLLIKKGTEGLATNNVKVYDDKELKQVKADFENIINKLKVLDEGGQSSLLPFRATQFDESVEHLIPDLIKIFSKELFEELERNILGGMGFVDIIQGMSSSRRESVLNPKGFMTEVQSGIDDFKQLLKDLIYYIKDANSKHSKYMNSDFYITSSPVKGFQTEEFKNQIRLLWKNGKLSSQTYCELVGEVDFPTEVFRRDREIKEGTEVKMYPQITENHEKDVSPTEEKHLKIEDKNGKPLPPDKFEKEQKEEFKNL